MKTREWVEAFNAGKVINDWFDLEISHGGKLCRLSVSADAIRVRQGADNVRRSAGAHACETLARLHDGYMITPKLIDLRHKKATVILEPLTASLIKANFGFGGGTITTCTDAQHSAAVLMAMQQSVPFETWKTHAYQHREGNWCVSNVGKHFVLNHECTDVLATNYGWLVHESATYVKSGARWWKGIKVYDAEFLPGWYVIQESAQGHGFGEETDQDDYSQFALIIAGTCWIDGDGRVHTSKLFTEPDLCGFIFANEQPLASPHHPGVETVVEIRPEMIPPPPSVPSENQPRWKDPSLTHGERKILWLIEQRELGVCEEPDGSNNGPEISKYHAVTIRDGVPGFGGWLSKEGGHWCASSASYCELVTRLESDPGPVMIPRAAGWEIERDAKADGSWRPTELIIRGEFVPEPGDIGTIQRGELGSGLRHVFTIKENVPERQGVITIGGNEGNRFGPDTFRKWSSLLGIRELGAGRYTGEVPYQGEDVPQEPPDHVHDGNNVLEGWGPMDPDPWIPEEWRGVEGSVRRWRTTRAGVSVKGEPGPRRTKGKPLTVGKVWLRYQKEIEEAHELTGVPLANILAMLTTEGGTLTADKLERFEAHLNDWSFGIAQTLTATAFELSKTLDMPTPRKPVPRGGDVQEWREFLAVPRNSVLIGAAYMAYNNERWHLLDDPILSYAAYNAGSPRVNLDHPWGVHAFRKGSYDALDVFAAWYGDACEVLG